MRKILALKLIFLLMLSASVSRANNLDSLQNKIDTAQLLPSDTTQGDTIAHPGKKYRITGKSLIPYIPPAVCITYGIASFNFKAIRRVDYSIYNDMQKDHPGYRTYNDNFLQFVPAVAVYGFNLVGFHGRHNFADRTIIFGLTEAIVYASTTITKELVGRTRPNEADKLSFPSGHTTNAFAAAEFFSEEYAYKSPLLCFAAYGCAASVGILRVYNNKHWFSDVITGAGYGIVSAKLANAFYPWFKKKLSRGKKDSHAVLMPMFQQGGGSLIFVKAF